MIFIIEDDELMAECVGMAVRAELRERADFTSSHNDVITVDNAPEDTEAQETESSDVVKTFPNAIEAMQAMDEDLPELIFLDVLLDGPDGFTLLHELVSYPDTAEIPVVIISSLELNAADLAVYGVVRVLNKAVMTPAMVRQAVREFCGRGDA